MSTNQTEAFVEGLYNIICENKELNREVEELRKYKRMYEEKTNDDYNFYKTVISDSLNTFADNLNQEEKEEGFDYEN